jgi:hypothetical protein
LRFEESFDVAPRVSGGGGVIGIAALVEEAMRDIGVLDELMPDAGAAQGLSDLLALLGGDELVLLAYEVEERRGSPTTMTPGWGPLTLRRGRRSRGRAAGPRSSPMS